MANNSKGVQWSREETILAFDLYCRIPFAKINKNNPDVIQLANLIGRSPSAVGMKLGNLGSYDPELQKKGKKGLSNASKLDEQIFREFSSDWEELSYQAYKIKSDYQRNSQPALSELTENSIPEGLDKEVEAKRRVGQDFFRHTVLSSYGNRCCVTGIELSELLVASHIKPWSVSDAKTERTNPSNGLCLNAFHDKAFDRGLITIDKEYRILISKRITDVKMDEKLETGFIHIIIVQLNYRINFILQKNL